jgi:hypothetical protein
VIGDEDQLVKISRCRIPRNDLASPRVQKKYMWCQCDVRSSRAPLRAGQTPKNIMTNSDELVKAEFSALTLSSVYRNSQRYAPLD